MTKPTAILTEANVIEILERLKHKVPHRLLAAEFGVSKKTISRINTGETWREVSLRFGGQPPTQLTTSTIINLAGLSTAFCDLHDELIAVKNHFGLTFRQPLYWGWFEGWDGLHALVSDGYIIWESADLVAYAQKVAATGICESPVWADLVEELPTFELESLMTQPIGKRLTVASAVGDIVNLVNGTAIRQRYMTLAANMKLDVREVLGNPSVVYFTRNKPKSKRDPTPIVIACVSTVQEGS